LTHPFYHWPLSPIFLMAFSIALQVAISELEVQVEAV
jgi:hypothetical protein